MLLAGTGGAFAYVKYIEGKMKPDNTTLAAIIKVLTPAPAPKEPLNFLLIGADATEDDKGRSDTLMILHVDPTKEKAVLISIPRDSRVEIPDNGKDKINHAYNYGGVQLTIETVKQYTGLDIHHYVVIDYAGFEEMVNAIGGITINVDKRMVDDELGEPIEEGVQHMDGITALHYVRWRNDERGDFSRIDHQQTFIRALIQESTRISNSYKLPSLVNALADHIETDMSPTEILEFANLAKDRMSQDKLETVMLPGGTDTIDGVSYVIPDEDKVEMIMNWVKKGQPIRKELLEEVEPSEVTVKVLNGSGIDGAATDVGDILADEGFSIYEVGNADKANYATSILYYRKEDYAKALKVKEELEDYMPGLKLAQSSAIDKEITGLLVVGKDFSAGQETITGDTEEESSDDTSSDQ